MNDIIINKVIVLEKIVGTKSMMYFYKIIFEM